MAATSAAWGTGYRPPFATATVQAATATAGSLSTSFAQIGTLPGASRTASGAASATTPIRIVDATGGVDSSSLLQYFTIPYIDAHTLSPPTWRYAYILWFVVIGTLVVWSIAHRLAGSGTGGTAVGALFRKYFVRRITFTKKKKLTDAEYDVSTGKHVQVGRKGVRFASPTFAQILTILALIVTSVCLSFVGPDYIAPTTCTFGGTCPYVSPSGNNGPPSTNFGRLARRATLFLETVKVIKRQNNPNGWAPFNDPLLASSNVDINFNAWTAAARLGLISYAMLPLAVTLAWPFNVWAIPFLTNYHFDKTAILHRWSGRVIWLFSSGHAAAWFYQLAVDKDPFGRPVLVPALEYWRFLGGLVPLMYWPIVALAWWGAERVSRFCIFLYVNGFAKGIWFTPPGSSRASVQSFSLHGAEKVDGYTESKTGLFYGQSSYGESAQPLAHAYPPQAATFGSPTPTFINNREANGRRLPPPGFASAQLLPGRTVRLTMQSAVPVRWQPGQHVWLTLPAVRKFQSHPYTIVSIDERARGIAPIGGHAEFESQGSEIVMLVRAQRGFSKSLWDFVVKRRQQKEERGASVADMANGIIMRSLISMPLGSSARTKWAEYDSLTIVCGGTGITFGMSVLEYTCKRMARRDGSRYRTNRVRFIWILREFAHVSWVSSAMRKCLELVGPSQLQIELFVSRPAPVTGISSSRQPSIPRNLEELAPPKPHFARRGQSDATGVTADYSDSEDENAAASTRMYHDVPEYGQHIDSVTDLVLFEGEDDERTAGEVEVSAQVRSMGKMRRALSRRGHEQFAVRQQTGLPEPMAGQGDLGFSSLAQARKGEGIRQPYPTGSSYSLNDSYHEILFASHDSQSDLYTLTGNSSMHHLVGAAEDNGKARKRLSSLAQDKDEFFDLTPMEQEDLEVVAELAKPGYPNLKEILDEEIARSTGRTMVACCGPNGLNTIVRHLVSSRIDVGKVLKGDPRGQVSLVCEDFSF
ncbi:hypothetical protein OIO90_003738 [Microbotryomycetes sp. JL221]|nr:hypothetical protein OIO90_003738 [Microbotryomycetes sp. JL221]